MNFYLPLVEATLAKKAELHRKVAINE